MCFIALRTAADAFPHVPFVNMFRPMTIDKHAEKHRELLRRLNKIEGLVVVI